MRMYEGFMSAGVNVLYVCMIKVPLHLFMCEFVLHVFRWGCQDLKYKILIKNKKLKPQIKTEGEESVDEGEEEEEEEDDEEDEEQQNKAKFWSPRKAGSKIKVSQFVLRSVCMRRCSTDIVLNVHRSH